MITIDGICMLKIKKYWKNDKKNPCHFDNTRTIAPFHRIQIFLDNTKKNK